MALLLILKKIGKLPLLSYYGRYSIIILCTSHLIYSPLKVLCTHLISEWGGGKCNRIYLHNVDRNSYNLVM